MRLLIAVMLALTAVNAQQPDPKAYIPRLERNLQQNIMPFWYPKTLDTANGGYIINHNARGEPHPGGSKGIVTQARQVWLFSRAARFGYRSKEMIEAARHGFQFLRDRMWDKQYGGFYWEVDSTGAKAVRPKKHLYGQSFALYALSEYYMASGDKEALALAGGLFALFEKHAHDAKYGGYREYFNQDWSVPPATESGYMSVTPDIKLMNTHLHLMEALTAYYRASKSPVVRERLIELINIETNAVVRKRLGACTDKYERDWTPIIGRDPSWDRVSYGHDLENIWLIVDAGKAAGISSGPYLDLFRQLFAYSYKYGYDSEHGGFYYTGAFEKPSDDRRKEWWVQAEAAVSALYMYRLTREPLYWEVFAKTYDFIEKYLTDWEVGEWHSAVSPSLKPTGGKANIWKAGYHNGRAMIECLEVLRALGPAK